jgi:hypothetical protein
MKLVVKGNFKRPTMRDTFDKTDFFKSTENEHGIEDLAAKRVTDYRNGIALSTLIFSCRFILNRCTVVLI